MLALAWVQQASPDRETAERFGRDLARLHAAGAASGRVGRARFGAPWPGFIASLPLPNDEADDWAGWYAEFRLLPYLRLARDRGALGAADAALVESVASRVGELAGPREPVARIHGDLWSGNVLWSAGRGWLIDPAAHGGHRESDLAMLALFGAPYLDSILAAYRDVTPLADGWESRVPLHQLHPLLVHVCLFGAAYREPRPLARAARRRATCLTGPALASEADLRTDLVAAKIDKSGVRVAESAWGVACRDRVGEWGGCVAWRSREFCPIQGG